MSRGDLERLVAIAREAGEQIMRLYSADFQVDYKSPGDPVTDADRGANELICSRLAEQFPDAAIVAEESEPEAYADYRDQARVFFVDPLDGTREFVAKNGQFVVMIGLVLEARAALGVVYAPATGITWYGGPGLGARRRAADGSEQELSVSSVGELGAARVTISRSRRSERLKLALERMGVRHVAPMGSAGLKGAHVAEASADVYLAVGFAGKQWDSCAVDALVAGAGGCLTDTRGRSIDYRSGQLELLSGIVASNPALHARVIERLNQS